MAQLGNVVVVNINYRLGMPAHLVLAASYECGSLERKTHIFLSDFRSYCQLGWFGFLANEYLLDENGKTTGNYGLLDQNLALLWVH